MTSTAATRPWREWRAGNAVVTRGVTSGWAGWAISRGLEGAGGLTKMNSKNNHWFGGWGWGWAHWSLFMSPRGCCYACGHHCHVAHCSDLEVVPQSDLSSTIIVSRCYNDLNFFLRLAAYSTKRPYLTGHRRLRLKTYNRLKSNRNIYSRDRKINATKTKWPHWVSC